MTEGVQERIPIGELCIDHALIRQAEKGERSDFEETLSFVSRMNLDIFTISPVYPQNVKRLPHPAECLWPDLKKWTAETLLFTFALLDGAFEWGLRLLGFRNFLLLDKTAPAALRGFIQQVEKLNKTLIAFLAKSGVDGVILADDIAFGSGLMTRPAVLREYFFPSLARQTAAAAEHNLLAFYHSDGNYREVIPDIIDAGFSGLHCLDKSSGMDMARLQQEVGNALCLWGHLDINDAIQAGDSARLPDLTAAIQRLATGKRFILGTNSGLFQGMNVEGLSALYRSISPLPKPHKNANAPGCPMNDRGEVKG